MDSYKKKSTTMNFPNLMNNYQGWTLLAFGGLSQLLKFRINILVLQTYDSEQYDQPIILKINTYACKIVNHIKYNIYYIIGLQFGPFSVYVVK